MASHPEITRERVEEVTSDWPDKPATLADEMVTGYGTSDEVTTERMIWQAARQWKRIQVYRDGTPHNFPKEHEDHLRQTIDYPIDPEDASDLLAFHGSNVLWRTRGELSADCHEENMNVLTLNLAHDVVTGEVTVDEARQAFAEAAIKTQMGMEPAHTRNLQFDVPTGDQGDPDESVITDALKQDVEEKLEGVVGGEEA